MHLFRRKRLALGQVDHETRHFPATDVAGAFGAAEGDGHDFCGGGEMG